MKKYKNILVSLVLFLIIGVCNVKATELTDLKATLKKSAELKNSYQDLYVEVTSDSFSENDYRALLSKSTDNIPTNVSNGEELSFILFALDNRKTGEIQDYLKYASQYGNVYITLYEYNGSSFDKASSPILIERPNYLPYTYRIVSQFYSDKSASFKVNEIYNENSTIKFKIGEVKDIELLKKFSNTSNLPYEELIEYAKNDLEPIQTNQVKINSRNSGIADGEFTDVYDTTNIVDGRYYYVYTEIDTEDGIYYPLVDIGLYKSQYNKNLVSSNYRSDSEYESNSKETDENIDIKDETVENVNAPNTGSSNNIIYIIIGMVFGIVGICIITISIIKYKTNKI